MRAINRRANPGGEIDLLLIGGAGVVLFLIVKQLGGLGQGVGQAAQGVGSAVGNTGNAAGQTLSAIGTDLSSADRAVFDTAGNFFGFIHSHLPGS